MDKRHCQLSMCICKRRVLVVDNDPKWRADHVKNLTDWDYEVYVAKGRRKALLEDAKKQAHEHRCHVALVDMRLLDDDDRTDQSGLELVQYLKPARSIVVTGYGNVELYRKAKKDYKAFEFVGKEEGPNQLHTLIRNAIDDTCIRSLRLYPDNWLEEYVAPRLKSIDNVPILGDEIREVLTILFPTASQIVLEQLSGSTQSSGQRSQAVRHRSIVFKATVDRHQPSFVKLAFTNWNQTDNDKVRREVENYKTHVEGQLGGNHHAHLWFHKRLWNIGGVAYSFFGNSENARVFTTFYAEQSDTATIIKPLQHFFGEVWHGKYQQRSDLKGSLFEIYDHVWDHALSSRLEGWRQLDIRRSFPGLDGEFSEPRAWLSRKKDNSGLANLRKCVIHGDFHADNLFVDNNGYSWAIDFERTGEGHILGDFVEIEQDIITRLAIFADQELSVFYELAVALIKPRTTAELLQPTENIKQHENAYKAFQVIGGLRKIASTLCQHKDLREYYWGLLLDALFVNSKLDQEREPGRWNKTLLLASIICARLDSWGTPDWPPKEWPPVQWTSLDAPVIQNEPFQTPRGETTHTKSQFDHGFGLLIGVGNTPSVEPLSLSVTVSDASAIQNILIDPARCAYLSDHVQMLTDTTASLDHIRNGFQRLVSQVRDNPEATVIIYFSGHGIYSQSDGRYGLLPSNIQMNNRKDGFDQSTVLWSEEFQALIEQVNAKRLLVLIDACHAQGTTVGRKSDERSTLPNGFTKAPPPDNFLSLLKKGEGRAVISSSRSNQKSYIRRDGTLSIFTYHLIEALKGANNHVGEVDVRISNLINHLGKRVPESVKTEYYGYDVEQVPWTDQAAEDFPIALIAGGEGL